MKKEADRREGKEMGVEVSSRARRSLACFSFRRPSFFPTFFGRSSLKVGKYGQDCTWTIFLVGEKNVPMRQGTTKRASNEGGGRASSSKKATEQ